MNHENEYENTPEQISGEDRFIPETKAEEPIPVVVEEAAPPTPSVAPPVEEPVTPPVVPPVEAPVVPPVIAAAPPRFVPDSGAAKKAAPPKKQKKSQFRHGILIVLLVLVVALCSSVFGGICGGVLTALLDIDYVEEQQNPSAGNTPSGGSATVQNGNREDVDLDEIEVDTSKQQTAAQIYHNNVASTVSINASVTSSFLGHESTSVSSGSGFIYSASGDTGYVVTNHHVVEGATSLSVILYDGTTLDATLLASDEANDIAVLKITAKGLKPVVLGSAEQLNVGDTVLAIGNPLGELAFSLTSGIVSGLDRQVEMSNGYTMSLIQTECPINSGNSGGALFNMYGEVVGIVNAKYSSNYLYGASIDNIGFAIPLDSVAGIIESIIKTGSYAKPYIGVSVTDPTGQIKGAQIISVEDRSPAATAGLQAGDIVTKANNTDITKYSDLGNFINRTAVGEEVKLTVYRGNAYIEITVTIGDKNK